MTALSMPDKTPFDAGCVTAASPLQGVGWGLGFGIVAFVAALSVLQLWINALIRSEAQRLGIAKADTAPIKALEQAIALSDMFASTEETRTSVQRLKSRTNRAIAIACAVGVATWVGIALIVRSRRSCERRDLYLSLIASGLSPLEAQLKAR